MQAISKSRALQNVTHSSDLDAVCKILKSMLNCHFGTHPSNLTRLSAEVPRRMTGFSTGAISASSGCRSLAAAGHAGSINRSWCPRIRLAHLQAALSGCLGSLQCPSETHSCRGNQNGSSSEELHRMEPAIEGKKIDSNGHEGVEERQ